MKRVYLAKPSGITLRQHVDHVVAEGDDLIKAFPITFKKYENRTGKDLSKRLRGACKFHDDGKKNSKWQDACYKDYLNFLDWQTKNGGDFQQYEKAMKGDSGKNIRNARIRHEIHSLIFNKDVGFSMPVKVAIAAHHSKLSNKHEHRWINEENLESRAFWNCFKNFAIENVRDRNDFQKAVELIYEYSGVRSLLQIADHRASAKENLDELPAFTAFNYKFPFENKRNVQKIIDDHWQEDLLLIRAPTGAGKTDASLLWASRQIENARAERLVIAMPTRFTSNALSINVSSSLSSTGLYHSSAWYSRYIEKIKSGEIDKNFAKKEHELARLLLAPVVVCTIDHLLIALSLSREDHHGVLFNLANSCVVIDEADFYDEFTQANILVLLEALAIWNVPVLIMSASLPETAVSMYQKAGAKVDGIKEDTSDNKRVRFHIKGVKEYTIVDELEESFLKCIDQKAGIIYANTVDKALKIYDWFFKKGIEPILYHSRFTEPDKIKKEDALIQNLGKTAWELKTAKGIAILTQIGELSINISADIMLTDLCPMDRFVQRVGRLSRFDASKTGEVVLLYPSKDGELYPAPYGTYVKGKGWIPLESLIKTKLLLSEKGYTAADLVSLVNEVYSQIQDFSDNAVLNSNKLKDYLTYNWLIGPKEISPKEADEAGLWKSRNIQGNESVFVHELDSIYFKNWSKFFEYKCENTVDLPIYLIEKGIKQFRLDRKRIFIGEDEHSIVVTRPGVYNPETGLVFREESLEDNFL